MPLPRLRGRHLSAGKQGTSTTAARNELYDAIQDRQRTSARSGELTPTSRFEEAAKLFLEKTKRKRATPPTRSTGDWST